MSVPALTRAVVLEDPVSAPDGAGGQQVTWAPLGTLWAEIRPAGGRERSGGLGPEGVQRLRVTLRAAPPDSPRRPRPGQRLREGARVFRLLTVAEADAQGRWLIAIAEEETPT